MTEIDRLKQANNRIFILVCLNFTLLFLMFCGIGFVAWQSASLINRLQDDLIQVEQALAGVRDRVQEVDMDNIMENVVASATETLKSSIRDTLKMSELGEPLEVLTLKIQSVEEKLQQTSTAIREINAELKRVGGDHFAQQVSYNLLKGLGDGLIQAAESGKPEIDTSHTDGQPQSVQ